MKTFGRNRDGRLNSYHLDISYMRFSRYIAKQIFFATDACICLPENILFYSVPARDRKNEVLEVQCKHLTVLSAIRKLNLFSSLITGKTSYFNSTALLIGLALISCCSSLPVSIINLPNIMWRIHKVF